MGSGSRMGIHGYIQGQPTANGKEAINVVLQAGQAGLQ